MPIELPTDRIQHQDALSLSPATRREIRHSHEVIPRYLTPLHYDYVYYVFPELDYDLAPSDLSFMSQRYSLSYICIQLNTGPDAQHEIPLVFLLRRTYVECRMLREFTASSSLYN